MWKQFLVGLTILALVLDGSTAFAGKSYSSGSSSRSSSSSGRSYSSGSRSYGSSSSGRSYSSGSSSSGRSYSSGSSSSKSSGGGFSFGGSSKPSSGGGLFGGSSSKPSTPSYKPSYTPPTHTYTPPSAQSGSKSYSSGSTSKPYTPSAQSGSKTYSSGPTVTTPSSRSNTPVPKYSSGGATSAQPPPSTVSSDGNSRKPTSSGFNSGMSNSAQKEQSRIRYEAATQPKPTYKPSPTAAPVTIKPDAPAVQTVRRYVTHERYVTYDHRASVFYGGYYGHPVYYNDFFSPFWFGWIMSDAINSHDRALWMYHHQAEMDAARYQAMLAKDAKLQAEIDALKAQNLARDPNYVPPQVADNPDIMYNKDFVNASYNPIEVDVPDNSGSGFLGWFFTILIVGAILGIFIYFMFVKEY